MKNLRKIKEFQVEPSGYLFEQAFKNIDDILHKDAGCGSELDYVEQTSSEQQRIVAILDEAFASIAVAKENAEKNF
ncbi:MAG: hypothetical protein BWY32_02798 [bacterium ADurb.Bin243]|mgnify:CR=1 FL=1|nr:MAG: hypothetical protein BWY32_02798 [bacterium ADurb.Bin243]